MKCSSYLKVVHDLFWWATACAGIFFKRQIQDLGGKNHLLDSFFTIAPLLHDFFSTVFAEQEFFFLKTAKPYPSRKWSIPTETFIRQDGFLYLLCFLKELLELVPLTSWSI